MSAPCGCIAVTRLVGEPLEASVPVVEIHHCPLHKAAPDLLEALRNAELLLRFHWQGGNEFVSLPVDPQSPLGRIRAAIAKAEGR